MTDVHALIMAKLAEREAEWAERERLEKLVPRGRKRVPGPTTVYSIRLDHDESAVVDRVDAAMEELRNLVP